MSDAVVDGFLRQQFAAAMSLADESDILDLTPCRGTPPDRYIARLHARGLVQRPDGTIVEFDHCEIGIWMPNNDYLRRVQPGQVLTYRGPHPRPFHPNILAPHICAHIAPATPLVALIHSVYELWSWQLFSTGDEGLNHAASQWARNQNPSRFPIDPRPLTRRALDLRVEKITPVSE